MLPKFIQKTLLFSALIAITAYFVFNFLVPQHYLPIFPFLIAFFVFITIGVHAVLTRAGKLKISKFSTYFIGSITAKLFIYIIFISIFVFTNKTDAVPFLITFLILYFLFTFFETYALLKDLKKKDLQEG